ncbi:hypothetical protein WJX84_001503 [Apatococcus fuscideae]|uniref:Pan3 C-terminal knob domain-containing protein n=1 Tax=Apatococcus fuscideae TaxID=2026836 RepID=A0AAW1T681_9CHLO
MSDVRGRRQQQQGSSSAGSSPSKDPQNVPSSLAGRVNAAPFVPGSQPREAREPAGSGSNQPSGRSHSSPRPSTAAGRQGGSRQGGARGAASNQASANNTPQTSPKPPAPLALAPTGAGFGADSVKAAPFIPFATADGGVSARLSQMAVNAPVFVPAPAPHSQPAAAPAAASGRSPQPIGALPVAPTPRGSKGSSSKGGNSSGGQRNQRGASAGSSGRSATPPPTSSQPGTSKSAAAQAASAGLGPSERSSSNHPADHPSLPDSDDLLGMTAHTPGDMLVAALASSTADLAALTSSSRGPAMSLPSRPPGRALGGQQSSQQQQQSTSSRGAARVGSPAPTVLPMAPPLAVLPPGRTLGRGMPPMGLSPLGTATGLPLGSTPGAFQSGQGRMQAAAHFLSERLRQDLQQRSNLLHAQAPADADGVQRMPPMLGPYHTLCPLEEASSEERPSQVFGARTAMFKGISVADGSGYALRRIDGRQVIPTADMLSMAQQAVEAWAPLAGQPHLNPLRGALISADLGGIPSLILAHDYHPGAVTLEAAHLLPATNASGLVLRHAPTEEQLWGYAAQLAAALRAVHGAGLACRAAALHPSKVLLVSPGRIRIGSLGVNKREAIPASSTSLRQDLTSVGRLLLRLACSGAPLPSLDHCAAHFSLDFAHLTGALLASAEGGALGHWSQLCVVLGERMAGELEGAHLYNEALIAQLAKEAENGRLLRLLARLSMVVDRPAGDPDAHWSETGDRYLLKLFHDFVLHQVSEDGAPIIDWGHVVEALNKLDAGVPEKVLLLSRDEASMLVVSYADIKRCCETAFTELKSRGPSLRGPQARLDLRRRLESQASHSHSHGS